MGLENMLIQTCAIYTRTSTTGKAGQTVDVYVKTYSNVACRSVHVGSRWGEFGGRVSAKATHLLYVTSDIPALDTTMRVLLDDGIWYAIEHGDAKYDSTGRNHSEYETFAAESPQSGR
jgi:hypothetical protein